MAAGMTGQERRQAPRVPERVAIALSGDGHAVQAHTQNLSTAGAYCLVDRFLPPMTKLELEFQLPDGSGRVTIRGTGVVVRAEPVVSSAERGQYHLAIFFSEMSERHRAAISKFVRQRLSSGSSTS